MATSKNIAAAADAVSVTAGSTITKTPTRALYIGSAGNIKVKMASGNDATLTGLVAGSIYPFAVTYVYSTSTTASGIVALY